MIQKTRGIVLRFTRFRETSIIVTIFTEAFGTQAYVVNNIRSQKAVPKIALYQPLTLLDLVVYHKPNQPISRIKEVKCVYAYQTFAHDVRKSTIAFFLTEVINKVLKEEGNQFELYDFLQTSFVTLDHMSSGVEHFHLVFLLKLSRLLGFGANRLDEVLLTGTSTLPYLEQLLQADYLTLIQATSQQRKNVLEELIAFYVRHVDGFGELRSLAVVRELLMH